MNMTEAPPLLNRMNRLMQSAWLAACIAFPVVIEAQSTQPSAQATTPAFTAVRGAFIGLSVANLDSTVAWYTQKLGMRVIMRPPKVEKSTAVILEGGGLIVELMHHDDAVPLRTAAPSINRNFLVHGMFKAGLFVEDFDKAIAEFRARGVQIAIGPFPARPDQPANAIIRDNEGNFIQFFGR